MRVQAAVVALVLLCGSSAMAQQTSWGAKGGVNLATLASDQDPSPDFKFKIGIVAGGFFTWPLGSRLDLQPELFFSQLGASLDAPGVDSVTIKIDSLVAPILVRYKLHSSANGLVLFAGPSLGFKLSAKAVAEVGGVKTKDDIGDDLESFDYGLVFGAGWEDGRWSLDGRYTWGLSNLAKDDASFEKTTHRVISVLAGVRF